MTDLSKKDVPTFLGKPCNHFWVTIQVYPRIYWCIGCKCFKTQADFDSEEVVLGVKEK